MSRSPGILQNFKGIGKVITAIAISVGVGAIVLSGFTGQAYDTPLVENERHAPLEDDGIQDTDNVTVTVDSPLNGVVKDSETITFSDASAGTNTTLTKGTNYTVMSYKNGKFDVVSVPNYNESDGDELFFDYEHKESNQATSILGDAQRLLTDVMDWMAVAVIMLFGVIFMRYME